MTVPPSLSQILKNEAARLGFHLAGITTPEPPAHLDVYQSWLAEGHHADMAWMSSDRACQRRADPRLVLPECRSILTLGIAYSRPLPASDSANGRIAAYAWGDDYHDLLPLRIKALVAFLEKQVGHTVPNRWYTDTGPILERELAQRAGLGWIGKNSLLINPEIGSYFILAEIFLGIDLPPDPPFTSDRCGTCTRCIDACPTDAILPNRTVDSNRCLSYLTIERKDALPLEYRRSIGDWLFGCDICQQVCPWNQKDAPPQVDPAFAPRQGLPVADLAAELSLSPQEFNRKFKGSPVKRAKRRGYLRNVAVVLGNLQDVASLPALIGALTDIEPLVRAHAAWALAQIGGVAAQTALQNRASLETDLDVLKEIHAALSALSV
ncbi:MAG: tRNA epoxyqueuosine(34) reductase QueG [Chloroflexota bacterium]